MIDKRGKGISGKLSALNNAINLTGKNDAPKKKTFSIKKLEECKSELENFLNQDFEKLKTVRVPNGLVERLSEYRRLYGEFSFGYAQKAVSDTVLREYYSSGKILERLKGLSEFAENISEDDNPEITAKMGYGNYIYLLKVLMSELKEKYEKSCENSKKETPVSYSTAEITISAAAEKIKQRAENFLKKYRKNNSVQNNSAADNAAYKEYCEIMSEYGKWTKLFVTEESIRQAEKELKKIIFSYKKRTAALKTNNKEAGELYAKLCRDLTPEWFACFNPEIYGNGFADMDTKQIKAFYCEKLEGVRGDFLKKENLK